MAFRVGRLSRRRSGASTYRSPRGHVSCNAPPRLAGVRCPVLVGRRSELTALRSALASARIGRGAAVALTGPPGIGKSRLLREATAAADAWDVPVLRGRALPST